MKTDFDIFKRMQEVHSFLNSDDRLKMHKEHRHQAKNALLVAFSLWQRTKINDEKGIAEVLRNLNNAVSLIEKTGHKFE